MNITKSQLENVKEIQTITAVSIFGTGFLTWFVSSFIELFGIENNMLAKKVEKAKNSAMQKLIAQAKAISDIDGIMNLNYQLSGKMVLISGTAYKKFESVVADSEGVAVISDQIPEI